MSFPSIVLAAAILAASFAPSRPFAAPFSSGGKGESARNGRDRFALVLIDTDVLACSPCQSSLLELCRSLSPRLQENRFIGVLTYRDVNEPDPRRARIARARWVGYSRANNIRFPVVVDETHAFNRLSEDRTILLLFDLAAGTMERQTAPFSPGALEGILRFLDFPEMLIIGRRP